MAKKKVCILAAHPDDEVLGCGGTIARHIARGDRVDVLILGEGGQLSRDIKGRKSARKLLAEIQEASRRALKVLGVKSVRFENLPDNRFDTVPLLDIVKTVEKHFARFRPHIIYTHFPGDLNIDHQITYKAAVTAARPLPECGVEAIYLFEVPSSTGWRFSDESAFKPNHFVDISRFMERKTSALKKYTSEMRPFPHSRSVRAVRSLAEYRGSTVGKKFCEAFIVERSVR